MYILIRCRKLQLRRSLQTHIPNSIGLTHNQDILNGKDGGAEGASDYSTLPIFLSSNSSSKRTDLASILILFYYSTEKLEK